MSPDRLPDVKHLKVGLTQLEAIRVWACKEIAEVEADERFHYEPAAVQINAPLALEQVALKARHRSATQVLKLLREG